MNFKDTLETDHLNMLSTDEFAYSCLNNRTGESFSIIKTDAFLSVDDGGLAIVEDKPMFNTSKKMIDSNDDLVDTDIKQYDTLTIDSVDYIVRDVRQDGIGGLDVYLKDSDVS